MSESAKDLAIKAAEAAGFTADEAATVKKDVGMPWSEVELYFRHLAPSVQALNSIPAQIAELKEEIEDKDETHESIVRANSKTAKRAARGTITRPKS